MEKQQQIRSLGLFQKSYSLRVFTTFCTTCCVVLVLIYFHLTSFGFPRAIPIPELSLNSKELQNMLGSMVRDVLGEPFGIPTIHPDTRHLHRGKNAMVASDVPLCSTMGRDILLAGGNAADAAITVALCIGLVNSHSSGIGGGGFITSFNQGEAISIDAREMAPVRAFKDMYKGQEILLKFGGLAVAVPGELAGLYALFDTHGLGNLTWAQLIQPVISLNRKGFKVGRVLLLALRIVQQSSTMLRFTGLLDSWDYIFKDKENFEFVTQGDYISRPRLADTLELIALNGSSAIFYDPEGPIVSSLVKSIRNCGGVAIAQDFADYKVHVTPALKFELDDNKIVYTSGGSSLGISLISGLNFFTSLEPTKDPVLHNHRIIESMKWMALARLHLGDFNHNLTHLEQIYHRYSGTKWANHAISKYNDNQTYSYDHYEPVFELTEPHGTLHFLVVDSHGNAVGMTTTVNLLFGLLVYDNQTGIVLNNEMDDFSVPLSPNAFNLTPSVFNYISGHRRPLSSTSPTVIVSDGIPELVIGAAGGLRITTAVFHAIIRILREKVPLLEAIAAPRLHHQLIPEFVMAENFTVINQEFDADVVDGLRAKNHTFWESGTLTVMNGIHRVKEAEGYIWEGVSDYWRKRGEAAGY